MSYKKILITGASGQDGTILTNILIKKKIKVIACIRRKKFKKIRGVIYEHINFFDKKKILQILKKHNPSVVVHFASNNPSFTDKKKVNFFFKDNYKMTKNIIDSIKTSKSDIHFIFPNSSQIFLNKKINIYNEKDKFFSNNSYCKFRIKIMDYLKKINKKNNFKYSNLILFNHDSIFRNKKFLLPRIILAIREKNVNFLNMIYRENIIQDFSHADDICFAIYLLIKKDINIKNLILSSSRKTKVNSIINYLIKKYSKKIKIKSIPRINNNYKIGDNKLAKNLLNWNISKNIYVAVDEMYKEFINIK